MKKFSKKMLKKAISHTGGIKKTIAKNLNISRNTLDKLLKTDKLVAVGINQTLSPPVAYKAVKEKQNVKRRI